MIVERRAHPAGSPNSRSAASTLSGAEAWWPSSATVGIETPATAIRSSPPGSRSGCAVEIDEQGDRHVGDRLALDDADAAHLDLAGDRRRRAGEGLALDPADEGVIVADQGRAAVDQPQREVGLAGARAAADQHGAAVDRDGADMDAFRRKGTARSCADSRKADDEAGARSPVVAVLDLDPPAMALDDRPGDGQARARNGGRNPLPA